MRRKPCQSRICWHAGTRAWRHVPVWDSQPVLSEGSVTVAVFYWELGHSTPWHQHPLAPMRQRGNVTFFSPSFPFPPPQSCSVAGGQGQNSSPSVFSLLKLVFFTTGCSRWSSPAIPAAPTRDIGGGPSSLPTLAAAGWESQFLWELLVSEGAGTPRGGCWAGGVRVQEGVWSRERQERTCLGPPLSRTLCSQ